MTLQKVSLAAVLFSTAGCMSLQPVPSVRQFVPQRSPQVVYVTYTDNSIVPVAGPRISGDTLLGTWQGLSEPVAIPLGEVKLVQARQRDRARTRWAVIGLSALGVASIYAITLATQKPGSGCIPQPPPSDPC